MRKRLIPALAWALPLLLLSHPAEWLLLLSAVLLHEGGHLAGFLLMREPAPTLSAVAAGLTLSPRRPLPYKSELVIALLGPIANLSLALPLLLLGRTEGVLTLGAVHLLTALCNLLPLGGCDGGRALFSATALLFPLRVAECVRAAASSAALFFLLFSFLFLLQSEGGGGVLLLLCALLARACGSE